METAFEYDSRCMDCVQQNPHYTEEHWRNIAGLGAPPQGGIVYVQAKPEGHGLAVASLVLAIVGVVFGLIPITFVVAWACGAAAFVLGVIADRKLKRQGAGRNMAVIGAMLGLLAVALGIVGYVVVQNSLHHLQDQLGS